MSVTEYLKAVGIADALQAVESHTYPSVGVSLTKTGDFGFVKVSMPDAYKSLLKRWDTEGLDILGITEAILSDNGKVTVKFTPDKSLYSVSATFANLSNPTVSLCVTGEGGSTHKAYCSLVYKFWAIGIPVPALPYRELISDRAKPDFG